MSLSVVIDELHVVLLVPKRLSENEARAVRRTLRRSRFSARLQGAIEQLIARFPSLSQVRITVSR